MKSGYNLAFCAYFLSGVPAATGVATGFSLAFNKPTASATPFSLTTSTPLAAPGVAGLSFGSVLTATAPQQPAAFGLGLGGAAIATAASLTGQTLGGSLFANTLASGEMQHTLSLSNIKYYVI